MGRLVGTRAKAALAALALLTPAVPALAQGTFSLPPGSATPAPRPPGPVDKDNPVIAPRATPSPRPTVALPTPSPTPTAAATTPAPRPGPAATRVPVIRPAPTSAGSAPGFGAAPLPLPSASGSAAPPILAPTPPPFPNATFAATEPASSGTGTWWIWLLGVLAVAAAIAAVLALRARREARDPVIEFEPPVVAPAAPELAAETVPAPVPVPARPTVAHDGPLVLTLEATRLSATLLNTTLTYALSLTNRSDTALGPIAVSGDMVAAHATLPVERQLAQDGQMLEQRHRIAALAPGESVLLKGEIRLPLAAIVPIRAGTAALFIPLARFRVEAGGLAFAHTFVVGEAPEQADAGLRPFRLDLGPRIYSKIGQREVTAAA